MPSKGEFENHSEQIEETGNSPKQGKQEANSPLGVEINKSSGIGGLDEQKEQEGYEEHQFSSLDLMWQHAFRELDEWAARLEFRDEVFLKEALYFAERIKRNQGNIKVVTDQFNKELSEWEKAARDELLMSTTTLQHFFPQRSYEEINEQIDQIQSRMMSILKTPFKAVSNIQVIDRYLVLIEQYISLRKRGREQYIQSIKQAANLIYENQKGFVDLFEKQVKTLMFPLNKYLEKAEELTK